MYTFLKSAAIRGELTYVIHANGRLLCRCDVRIDIFSVQDVKAIIQTVHVK